MLCIFYLFPLPDMSELLTQLAHYTTLDSTVCTRVELTKPRRCSGFLAQTLGVAGSAISGIEKSLHQSAIARCRDAGARPRRDAKKCAKV